MPKAIYGKEGRAIMHANCAAREVVLDDPDLWPYEGPAMKFRLTYQGCFRLRSVTPETGNQTRAPKRNTRFASIFIRSFIDFGMLTLI
jgi:hypothetical protein